MKHVAALARGENYVLVELTRDRLDFTDKERQV